MNKDVVKSVGRVFSVLELFKTHQKPMTATEVCNYLDYPKSSADALLKSLVSLGYLTLDINTTKYFVSLRVTKLGDWLPELFGASSDALQILDHIHKALGETVTLSMPNGMHMQLITVITGTFPISLSFQQGTKLPLFTTGIGIVQLATRSDEEIAKALKRANRRATNAQQRVNLEDLMVNIELTRAKGYCEAYDRFVPDTGAIAMALPGISSESSLVVAVGGLSDRIKKNEGKIIQEMRQAIRHYKKH
tara:strand:+ start:75 stop:821 length:747 start_codon:yes stop_codon:yes gene_type:complete